MSKYLVALDGSDGSEKALDVAVRLAQQGNRELLALAVLDCSGDSHLNSLVESVRPRARDFLKDTLEAAANFARSRGVQLTPILHEGHPAEAIVSYAEHEGTEIVIVGSGGAAPQPGLGGTADQVSSHAPCTVLIVR